jgi:hypothetical protein
VAYFHSAQFAVGFSFTFASRIDNPSLLTRHLLWLTADRQQSLRDGVSFISSRLRGGGCPPTLALWS